ncbi:SRPBCC domain-containing protein [Amycolatopsis sp. K13G38]|uniref:SRPBCC domain-containing protein n=1 Tax=Amycolatopsis acididurans TaxID=2724524 RepID=A0ABX1JI90_9PSEU|nr:SRPBCC domain-containing protein [Amycolatopsis acididurans]NKQ57952.1 SRPBCC domain-containing protein [Amycolatopsis acididurans]
MGKEFEIKREVVLPATPEQVFAAATTGTGNWMFPTPEPSPGDPAVKVWEPPHHVAFRQESGDWFNALEYVIEARDGGTTTLRYVHSGVFTDDWDNQYDGASKHTDFYHHTLAQYLTYFADRTAAFAQTTGPAASSTPDGLEKVKRALGVTHEGQTVRLDVPGADPVDAVVDYLNPYFIGLRTPDALHRVFGRNHFGATVDTTHHLFGAGADADKTGQAWQSWLNGVFAG